MFMHDEISYTTIGYELAGLTVHPPQKKTYRRWVNFFRIGVLIPPKFFPKEKGDYVGDMRTRTPKNVVFRHNRSKPISTRLTLFGNIE